MNIEMIDAEIDRVEEAIEEGEATKQKQAKQVAAIGCNACSED